MLKLNLCCGEVKVEGFVNIDKNEKASPDLLFDITKAPWPYEDSSVDEIQFMHGPEHIMRFHWDKIFCECIRVLKPLGKFVIAYPEFRLCAEGFVNNIKNNRDFWLATLYGRRLWEGDEHVTAIDSPELQEILESVGFFRIYYSSEGGDNYFYTIMVCYKNPEFQSRETLMASELALPGKMKSIKEI